MGVDRPQLLRGFLRADVVGPDVQPDRVVRLERVVEHQRLDGFVGLSTPVGPRDEGVADGDCTGLCGACVVRRAADGLAVVCDDQGLAEGQ